VTGWLVAPGADRSKQRLAGLAMAGGVEGFFAYRGISAERLSVSIAKETTASIVRAAAMPTTTTIRSARMILTPFHRL
jgi:hypothetical protein